MLLYIHNLNIKIYFNSQINVLVCNPKNMPFAVLLFSISWNNCFFHTCPNHSKSDSNSIYSDHLVRLSLKFPTFFAIVFRLHYAGAQQYHF